MSKVVMRVVENGNAEIDRESSKKAHFTSFATFYTYFISTWLLSDDQHMIPALRGWEYKCDDMYDGDFAWIGSKTDDDMMVTLRG